METRPGAMRKNNSILIAQAFLFVGRHMLNTFRWISIWQGILTALLLGASFHCSLSYAGNESDSQSTLQRIQADHSIRIGMYLGFEGLSFRERGALKGLEVELAELLCDELSRDLGTEIRAEIVNQEWSQIIKVLRDKKYDVAFSAIIPNNFYDRYGIHYSRPYLQTGPTICCREANGIATSDVTEDVHSLSGKRIVVINDPAIRHTLRHCGVYIEEDENEQDLERKFPRSATMHELQLHNQAIDLIPVKEIIQVDEMPRIYDMIASGAVNAGVIDQGIIWWVSTGSRRWASKIHSFSKPIGPYVYCAVTRNEDQDLSEAIDRAIATMLKDPRYQEICDRWHGPAKIDWNLDATAFLEDKHPHQANIEGKKVGE